MGILLSDGFDMYSATSPEDTQIGVRAKWSSVGGNLEWSLGAGRFGGQCLTLGDATGSTSVARRQLSASSSSFCLGFAWRLNTPLTNFGTQPVIRLSDSGLSVQLSIYMMATGQMKVTRGAATADLITSASPIITTSVWNYYILFGNIDDVLGSLSFYQDSTLLGTFSGDTKQSAIADVGYLDLYNPDGSGSSNSSSYDDVYVHSLASNMGIAKIETLRPSADTAQKDFTPNTGTTNYNRVNATNVPTVDSSYVEANTVGDQDLYDLDNLSSIPDSIIGVNLVSFGKSTDATPRSIYLSANSGGAGSDGPAQSLSSSYSRQDRAMDTDPNTGTSWTAAGVNALKVGPKVAV